MFLKLLLKFIIVLLLFGVVTAVVYGNYRTWKTQRGLKQQIFLSGGIPDPLPDGLYAGSVTGYEGSWKGKTFDRDAARGINIFEEDGTKEERYPFKTLIAAGLRDSSVQVLKIDYDLPENPWWLRAILDEVVETDPGTYLGKLHIRLPLGFSFALGYFQLRK